MNMAMLPFVRFPFRCRKGFNASQVPNAPAPTRCVTQPPVAKIFTVFSILLYRLVPALLAVVFSMSERAVDDSN